MSKYKILINPMIIGDSKVGKTCIHSKYTKNKFSDNYKATIGADFGSKEIELDDKKVIIQLWDSAGRETFGAGNTSLYKHPYAFIVCFDLTNKESFENLNEWIRKIRESENGENKPIILIGNKSDLKKEIAVDNSAIFTFVQKNDQIKRYFETSAKTGKNISEAIEYATKSAIQYREEEEKKNEQTTPSPIINECQIQQSQRNNLPLPTVRFQGNKYTIPAEQSLTVDGDSVKFKDCEDHQTTVSFNGKTYPLDPGQKMKIHPNKTVEITNNKEKGCAIM